MYLIFACQFYTEVLACGFVSGCALQMHVCASAWQFATVSEALLQQSFSVLKDFLLSCRAESFLFGFKQRRSHFTVLDGISFSAGSQEITGTPSASEGRCEATLCTQSRVCFLTSTESNSLRFLVVVLSDYWEVLLCRMCVLGSVTPHCPDFSLPGAWLVRPAFLQLRPPTPAWGLIGAADCTPFDCTAAIRGLQKPGTTFYQKALSLQSATLALGVCVFTLWGTNFCTFVTILRLQPGTSSFFMLTPCVDHTDCSVTLGFRVLEFLRVVCICLMFQIIRFHFFLVSFMSYFVVFSDLAAPVWPLWL